MSDPRERRPVPTHQGPVGDHGQVRLVVSPGRCVTWLSGAHRACGFLPSGLYRISDVRNAPDVQVRDRLDSSQKGTSRFVRVWRHRVFCYPSDRALGTFSSRILRVRSAHSPPLQGMALILILGVVCVHVSQRIFICRRHIAPARRRRSQGPRHHPPLTREPHGSDRPGPTD